MKTFNFQFSRDPVLWLNLIALVIMGVSTWLLPLSDLQQAALNGFAFFGAGLIAAFQVGDGQVAAIMGFLKAGLAVGLGFGLHMTPTEQALALGLAAGLLMVLTRSQVVSPVPGPKPPATMAYVYPTARPPGYPGAE